MGRKQYGKRAGGCTSGGDGEIYSRACGTRTRRKKSGKVHPTGGGSFTSSYVPLPMEKTNNFLAKNDATFQHACQVAGVDPSGRQYGKWRAHKGIAYQKRPGGSS